MLGKIKLHITEISGTQHYTFPMITTKAPFDDLNVRLALKYALDRQALVDTILRGHGSVGNDHPVAVSNRFYNRDLPQRAYDPDKARFHLKKSGHADATFVLNVSEAAFAGAVDAAILYQAQAKEAGIKIAVQREPNDGYWSSTWMKKPWCASYWGGRPTEDWVFSTTYARGANWNETFWDNARFNQLLLAARSELDETKRRAMYYEMQQLLADEGGAVVPMFANYVGAASNKVGHGQISAHYDFDGHRIAERWWLKA